MKPFGLFAFAFVLLAPTVAAQSAAPPASPPSLSETLQGPSKEAYESGKLLAANRDFAGALTKFRQAYESSSDPRLLYDMGVCEKNLRHYARMQGLLQHYLRDSGGRLSPEERAMVDDALEAIKNLVARIDLTSNEEGATVLLDGEAAGTTPMAWPLVVDLGKHTLVVKKPGFESVEQTIDAAGGGESTVAVTLRAQSHFARLVVATDEAATVMIDSAVVGTGHFEGRLAPGAHEVRVTESGRTPYQASVELRDGEMRTMQVTLESGHGTVWPWVVGGVILAAGAAVGGYYLLKPQDQMAPPPTGTLNPGSVQFQLWRR